MRLIIALLISLGISAVALPSLADEVVLSEQFDGQSGLKWQAFNTQGSVPMADIIATDGGTFFLRRQNAGPLRGSAGMRVALDQALNGTEILDFTATALAQSAPDGCVGVCQGVPISVEILVALQNGTRRWLSFGLATGPARADQRDRSEDGLARMTFTQSVDLGVSTDVTKVLADVAPDAVTLLEMRIVGRGFDFVGRMETVTVLRPHPADAPTETDDDPQALPDRDVSKS